MRSDAARMRHLLDHDPARFFDGRARWIWSDEGVWGASPDPRPIQVRWFARRVRFARGGACVLALSADTRYLLHVNGAPLARGPQKGDVAHQFYDALDLSDDLRDGDNLLLVRVDCAAKSFPYYMRTGPSASEMSAATLFVADGWVADAGGARTLDLASGPDWLVRVDPHLDFRHDEEQPSYVGYKETVDQAKLPPTFFADGDLASPAWRPATVVHPAFTPATAQDAFFPHRLIPRAIAPLAEAPAPIAAIRAARDGDAAWARLVDGALTASVPARARLRLILDLGALRTAYPTLLSAGGAGARVRLKYAECCFADGKKAHRDRVDGAEVVGYSDHVVIGGGERAWTPLMWRTLRYAELTIETADAPLTLRALSFADCHYPIAPVAEFRSSDAQLERMWAVGVRTQQACAHDTFEDCPYYEQLQYAGDTQMQALFTYAVAGERRLPLQAIRFFHWSMLPEGITQSRYPSRPTQVIPFWSLHWLLMLWDWWRWSGDVAAIRVETLAAVQVVRWFLDRRDASGLVGKLPYWCVADWSPEWCARFGGNVPGVKDGPSALPNLMLVACLERVGELLGLVGEHAGAQAFADEARALRSRIEATFWDARRGLYRDAAALDVVSQLTNAWALLVDLPPAERRAAIAERMATTPDICRAAYFGHTWLFEAWTRAGRQDLVLAEFASYRRLLDLGVSTWPEDAVSGRSECHAWSNAASYHLLRTVLGVSVADAGCAQLRVAPYVAGLDRAAGAFATPRGALRVAYERGKPLTVIVPDGTRATVAWSGAERELGPGEHRC